MPLTSDRARAAMRVLRRRYQVRRYAPVALLLAVQAARLAWAADLPLPLDLVQLDALDAVPLVVLALRRG